MAILHKEFIQFNKELKLTIVREDGLKKTRKDIKRKIRNWFAENKPDDLQPKFAGQGSFEMKTIVNPIPEYENDAILRKYDLDYGIYFIENEGEDNKRTIDTWHNWVYEAVKDHTDQDPKKKNTCVRVIFADGHHIDLPIYYKENESIFLAHKTKDWIESDPKEFYEWFNTEKNAQIERMVRYLKAWKNYRETKNDSLKLPSGFSLTILMVNSYAEYDNDDQSFRETIRNMHSELSRAGGFKCLRPTTPVGEDVFQEYSETRKANFLNALESLLDDMVRADEEKNFREASEILRKNQFGSRFPLGEDKNEGKKSATLAAALGAAAITQSLMDIKSQVMLVVKKYPKLTFDPTANTLYGSIMVDSEDFYDISIELSPYPEYFPVVYETGERIPKEEDRHIYSDSGSCCFTTNAKAQILLKTVISCLVDFMKEIVVPYFMNNSYYELNGRYYTEEYSHGPIGVVEGYRDILQISDDLRIAKIMLDYLNDGKLNVHQKCYCGSGISLLRCKKNGIHDKCYRNFRKVNREQIRVDLHAHFYKHLKQTEVIS